MFDRFAPAAIIVTVGAAVMGASAVNAQNDTALAARIAAVANDQDKLNTLVAELLAEGKTVDQVAYALAEAKVVVAAAVTALNKAGVADAVITTALVKVAPDDQKTPVSSAVSAKLIDIAAAVPTGAGPVAGPATGTETAGIAGAGAPLAFTGSSAGGGAGGGVTASPT